MNYESRFQLKLVFLPSEQCSAFWVFTLHGLDSDLLQCIVGGDKCSRCSLLEKNSVDDVTCDGNVVLFAPRTARPLSPALVFTIHHLSDCEGRKINTMVRYEEGSGL